MRKNIFVCVLVMALVLILAGCSCKHEWTEATCVAPKTCSLCGETEGEALGHTWQDATCAAPKTCSVCQATEGELGGHVWIDATCTSPKTCSICQFKDDKVTDHTWQDATCEAPKTCSVCQATQGEALGHTWQEATCLAPKTCSVCQATEGELADHKWEEATTEAPKTCSVCKETSGKKLYADSRFTTASTKILQGTWICDVTITGEMVGLADFGGVPCRATLTFGNTGSVTMTPELKDEATAMKQYRTYAIDKLYAQYAAEGKSQQQADQAMLDTHGLNVPDYVDSILKKFNVNNMLAAYGFQKVYYVEGSNVFTASSWSSNFESNGFTINGGKLIINGVSLVEGGETLVWTRG